MSPETYEQLIYLPDDNPFFRMPEDKFHRRKLAIRAIALTVLAVGVYVRLLWSGGFIWLDETRLHEMWSWKGLVRIWTHGIETWQPLGMSLLWAEHHFF